uniref:Uncharacterized protein n=1 Tax=Salvator merianae TaxID=96440 RepID=A0A8D0BPN3_SALMN
MATGKLIKNIFDEATCSLCLEYFKDPVSVDCGHNFCQACITQCLETTEAEPSCPQCRQTVSQRNVRPNHQLANLAGLIKRLQQEMQKEEKWGVCGQHQEPLKLFCKEDRMCICLVCHLSKEHKDHPVVLLEEASQKYKVRCPCARWVVRLPDRRRRQNLHPLPLLTLLEEEKQKVWTAFEKLQEVLEENKHFWMSWLEDLQKKKKETWEENAAELLDKITHLSSQIAELEKKRQQPAGEFLQPSPGCRDNSPVDVRLLRHSQELESTLTTFTHKREAFEKIFRDCQVHVTLDQETAHLRLSVSENQRSVTGGENCQSLPSNPERFDTMSCVLGCEKFSAGRHYWDVEIEGYQAAWAVGVARESVKRKGYIYFTPEEGIWAMQNVKTSRSSLYQRLLPSSHLQTATSLESVRKIRVFLDYEAGHVAFSDPSSGRSLFTFSSACFAGERLCPFFQVGSLSNICQHVGLLFSPLSSVDEFWIILPVKTTGVININNAVTYE